MPRGNQADKRKRKVYGSGAAGGTLFGSHSESESKATVVLIGDTQVGKSCLLERYINDAYDGNSFGTLGTGAGVKKVQIEGKTLELGIRDPSGAQRFLSVAISQIKNSHAVIICYDVTNAGSWSKIQTWIDKAHEKALKNAYIILVGCKTDLADDRVTNFDDAKAFAKGQGISYFECSARNNVGVNEIFLETATNIMERFGPRQEQEREQEHNPDIVADQSGGCTFGCTIL